MSMNQRLADIREMQGKPPINPSHIEGFGPATPMPEVPASWLDPENDAPEDGPPPPPQTLVPTKRQEPATAVHAQQPTPPMTGEFSLVVCDRVAAWKGQAVDLLPAEEGAIRRVVLLAIQRGLDADLSAVAVFRRPQRNPKGPKAPEPSEATGGAPAKRGRPRRGQA